MKRNKFLIALSFCAAITACKKLETIPDTDLLAGSTALSTVTFVEQAVLGAYAALPPDMAILLNATFSDEVAKSEFYNAVTTHEWQYGPADVGLRDNFTAINPLYRAINRANVALAALPDADSTVAGDEQKRARLRGELLFIRAYAHFELFRYYSGNYEPTGLAMPYMKTSTLVPTPRIQMEPYFQELEADMAQAKSLLPTSLADINRATRPAASGLQARVALYKRDWAAAETFASEYIAAIPLASISQFPGIWTDANSAEQAWRIVRTSTIGGRLGSLFRATSTTNGSGQVVVGLVTWKPSEEIWTSYNQATDVRFPSYFKDEPLLSAAGRPSRIIAKYAGGAYATATENVANVKMFRTAEMYLIRAEARAEQNRFTGANSAEADINELRNNRITGYTPMAFTSKQQAIDEIMLERFKELAYEGHRFFDLKRRGLPVERIAADAPSPAGTTLPAGNFRFVLPIPLPEVTANPTMQQNPGYN